MEPKKEKACHRNDRPKEGDMLLDSAKIIASSPDPVKLVAEQIRYNRLAAKIYRKNVRVK